MAKGSVEFELQVDTKQMKKVIRQIRWALWTLRLLKWWYDWRIRIFGFVSGVLITRIILLILGKV